MCSKKDSTMENNSVILETIKFDFCVAIKKCLNRFKEYGYYKNVFDHHPELFTDFSQKLFDYMQNQLTEMDNATVLRCQPVEIDRSIMNDGDETLDIVLHELIKTESVWDDDSNANQELNDNNDNPPSMTVVAIKQDKDDRNDLPNHISNDIVVDTVAVKIEHPDSPSNNQLVSPSLTDAGGRSRSRQRSNERNDPHVRQTRRNGQNKRSSPSSTFDRDFEQMPLPEAIEDERQLLGSNYDNGETMVHLARGIYCTEGVLKLVRSKCRTATGVSRYLMRGIVNPAYVLNCTLTGTSVKNQGRGAQNTLTKPFHNIARNVIINYSIAFARQRHWPIPTRRALNNSMTDELGKMKREYRRRQEQSTLVKAEQFLTF